MPFCRNSLMPRSIFQSNCRCCVVSSPRATSSSTFSDSSRSFTSTRLDVSNFSRAPIGIASCTAFLLLPPISALYNADSTWFGIVVIASKSTPCKHMRSLSLPRSTFSHRLSMALIRCSSHTSRSSMYFFWSDICFFTESRKWFCWLCIANKVACMSCSMPATMSMPGKSPMPPPPPKAPDAELKPPALGDDLEAPRMPPLPTAPPAEGATTPEYAGSFGRALCTALAWELEGTIACSPASSSSFLRLLVGL
mmetsp:Transcript_23637/g.67818  ORF Transcript_23637/g.67818 Transcript_23637/m.67818 type:complete len:252 (+) Transcript_23637:401-1156(+)